MIKNKFGELVFSESDLIDLLMQGHQLVPMIVDKTVEVHAKMLDSDVSLLDATSEDISIEEFDHANQSKWHMPKEYKNLDIAEYIIALCKTDVELQRVAHELLLYQEKQLFDLLKYLKYLVDTMKKNNIIWGVGRGSSVASYVLYLLEVHRIDSIYYDLAPEEFLR